jgi:hypothetical protein
MRLLRNIVAGVAMTLLVSAGAFAGTDLNEVGAFLVYPAVIAATSNDGWDQRSDYETFITITNASALERSVHVSYINGDEWSYDYCFECDFNIPLTPNDTELLVVTYTEYGIQITSEDGTVEQACSWPYGFITVNLEEQTFQENGTPNPTGVVVTDNILLGSEVVVNYRHGFAFSLPAIPFQGKSAGNGDRKFAFNDQEYGKLPRIVAADFIAPDHYNAEGDITAALVLFTLGFERQHPPQTDCSVIGYDAAENPFSASFIFGCWTYADLCDISPEFCYPNLGQFAYDRDTHGWLKLSCRVDVDGTDNGSTDFDVMGGVHGALIQTARDGDVIRRGHSVYNGSGRELYGNIAWARLLYQSVTTGDSVTLHLEELSGGGLD